ncbi:MAG: tetratricopeptide repeat protein [Nitrospinota bacterium]|nr:MAG: tetratricopeptide repeat protein [Nitrospinota bacterium]
MQLEARGERRAHLWAGVLLVFLSLGIFISTLSAPFLWDDRYLILTNTRIKDWSHLSQVMREDFWVVSEEQSGYYRPLITLSYMLNYALSEMDPYGYHVTNLYFHIANVLLVYWLTWLLWRRKPLALIAGLLFATHPMHTESVTWIAGRTDVIASFFFLLAFILYLKTRTSWKLYRYVLALLCYFLALLSKEVALVFPLLLFLYDYIFVPATPARRRLIYFLRYHFPFWFLSLLYFGVKVLVTGTLFTHLLSYAPGRLLTLVNALKLLFHYLLLLLFPLSFNAERDLPVIKTLFSGETFFYAAFGLAFWGSIWMLRKRKSLLAFSLAWIVVTLLPVLNLIPIGDYMAERFLYLPSVGFAWAGGYGLAQWYTWKRRGALSWLAAGMALLVLVFYSTQTIRRNADWRDPIAFWTKTVQSAPQSARAALLLSMAYYEQGYYTEAIPWYKRAVELDPTIQEEAPILGALYYRVGKLDEAIQAYQAALEFAPRSAKIYMMLGFIHREKQEYPEAVASFQKAIALSSPATRPYYYLLLGITYQDQGRVDEALAAFQQAQSLAPQLSEVYPLLWKAYQDKGMAEQLGRESQQAVREGRARDLATYYYAGITYEEKEEWSQALAVYQAALSQAPHSPLLYNKIGLMYDRLGDLDAAETAYKTALKYNFYFASAHYNLGTVYMRKGLLEQAVIAYERAIQFDPHHKKARHNLAVVSYELGTVYTQRKQTAEAIRAYRRFLRYWQGDKKYTTLVQARLKELQP